jgi:putative sterol carrier protein
VSVDPGRYAALVAEASDEELAEGVRQNRDVLLEEVFRQMPEHFRTDHAPDLRTVIEWRIGDRQGGGHDRYQLVIEDGSCRAVRDGEAEPVVTFTIGAVDFLKLITGNAAGPMLFTFGRLKVRGDLLLAARLPRLFAIPRPAAYASGGSASRRAPRRCPRGPRPGP